jgi:tripartite-type tricarboxylate transporter receptor subunit TctC
MKIVDSMVVAAGVTALAISAPLAAAAQQQFPTKPIRLVVPFPPGAASDFLARVVGQKLGDLYGQQTVVDNRPGAGGLIGSQIVLKGAGDGYTLGIVGQPHLTNTLIRAPKPYDAFKDFTSIGMVASIPNVIVIGNGVPVKNVSELIALAKAKPGSLNFGSAGVGSSSHLAGELFIGAANITAVHVPFKSLADVFSEMIAGRVHFYVFPLPAAMPMLKEGRLKPIAVATPKRAAALPDVPTTAEAGLPQYQSDSWFGIVAPAGVPKQIVAKLNGDMVRVLKDRDTFERFEKQGAEPAPGTPEAFQKLQAEEFTRISKLVKQLGIKPN